MTSVATFKDMTVTGDLQRLHRKKRAIPAPRWRWHLLPAQVPRGPAVPGGPGGPGGLAVGPGSKGQRLATAFATWR